MSPYREPPKPKRGSCGPTTATQWVRWQLGLDDLGVVCGGVDVDAPDGHSVHTALAIHVWVVHLSIFWNPWDGVPWFEAWINGGPWSKPVAWLTPWAPGWAHDLRKP